MRQQLRSALIALGITLMLASLAVVTNARGPAQTDVSSYLPLVLGPEATRIPPPTATPTNTATPTKTPTATRTPTVTPQGFDVCQLDPNPASAPNFPIMIDDIDKVAETVALKNVSGQTIDLTGWHMCSINGNQEHIGLNGTLAPGQVRTFAHSNPGPIWNDTQRDDGALYNPAGQLIAYDENID